MTKKSKIPKPPQKKKISEDNSEEYLKKWYELLDHIAPELLSVFPHGHPECPKNFYDVQNLRSDVWYLETPIRDMQIQFMILPFGSRASFDACRNMFGPALYLCDYDYAFGESEVINDREIQDKPWINHEETVVWKKMYEILVELVESERNRIPVPPEQPA